MRSKRFAWSWWTIALTYGLGIVAGDIFDTVGQIIILCGLGFIFLLICGPKQ